eukprot:1845110-Rhodomonas_salina.1
MSSTDLAYGASADGPAVPCLVLSWRTGYAHAALHTVLMVVRRCAGWYCGIGTTRVSSSGRSETR